VTRTWVIYPETETAIADKLGSLDSFIQSLELDRFALKSCLQNQHGCESCDRVNSYYRIAHKSVVYLEIDFEDCRSTEGVLGQRRSPLKGGGFRSSLW
jgi:hypothetical protein